MKGEGRSPFVELTFFYMVKLYSITILFLLSVIALVYYELNWKLTDHHEVIHDFIIAALFGTGGYLLNYLSSNWGAIKLALKCQLHKNEDIYVSLSYLFKIKIDGENKYLMVKSNKIPNQYQPVGGVYKRFPSSVLKWREWGANEAKNDRENKDDLRFNVKRKHIPKIRKWFYQRENREVDVWREFCEELVITGILPKNGFEHIKPEFLYRKEEHLIFRKGKENKQFLIYDIFSINFSKEQEEAIFNLYNQDELTEGYAFVDERDLDKELFIINNKEYQLGYHARYLKTK